MKADYSLIPERIMSNLLYYVKGEEAPGGFLYSVLCNDLWGAVFKADDEVKRIIPLLVMYIHWEVPAGCHGSAEHVKEWMNKPKVKESVS